jgi:hypothetical protein
LRDVWSSWDSDRIGCRDWYFGSDGDTSVMEAELSKLGIGIGKVDLEGGEDFEILENLYKLLGGIASMKPSPGSGRFHFLHLFPDADVEGLIEDSESLSSMPLVLL